MHPHEGSTLRLRSIALVLGLLVAIAITVRPTIGQPVPAPPPPPAAPDADEPDPAEPSRFNAKKAFNLPDEPPRIYRNEKDEPLFPSVMCMALDASKCIWIGTEDFGVWRYDPRKDGRARWTQFTTADGLGDNNAYAMAFDKLGRLWVAQQSHGVAVFNGRKWKTYDVLAGPLGERVYDIKICPADGDVWLATSLGLTRYSLAKDTWRTYTRADGLVSDQLKAIAFDKAGTLFVGTGCDGLIKSARVNDDYPRWQVIAGAAAMPHTPTGKGLPTNQINDVLVTRDGTLWVATTTGLARSADGGATFTFTRGQNWEAKVNGLFKGPAPVWNVDNDKVWLAEDYVTCLREDAAGLLWLGFRKKSYQALDPKTELVVHSQQIDGFLVNAYVDAILPMGGEVTILGLYGQDAKNPRAAAANQPARLGDEIGENGTQVLAAHVSKPTTAPELAKDADCPPLPGQAKPPADAELAAMAKRVKAVAATSEDVDEFAEFLSDDWATRGDWVGRYGRELAVLCAMASPADHAFGSEPGFRVTKRQGPQPGQAEGVRHWIECLKCDDPRALYSPKAAPRRIAEWNDGGYATPTFNEGPDLWVRVTVPKGTFRVSLYELNYNGQVGQSRLRDELIEVRFYIDDIEQAHRESPVLARSRVWGFYGGVYKRFIVKGPADYHVRISRNHGSMADLSGVFIDRLTGGEGNPALARAGLSWLGGTPYNPPAAKDLPAEPWADLWRALDEAQASPDAAPFQTAYRIMALRAALAKNATAAAQGHMRWRIPIWTAADREEFDKVMADAWAAMLKANPELKRDRPNSPEAD